MQIRSYEPEAVDKVVVLAENHIFTLRQLQLDFIDVLTFIRSALHLKLFGIH